MVKAIPNVDQSLIGNDLYTCVTYWLRSNGPAIIRLKTHSAYLSAPDVAFSEPVEPVIESDVPAEQ